MTGAADLVIVGRVATLAGDSGLGWQGGIAIAGDRVVAVGGESDLEDLIGPRTERWRLDDDLAVMPGITDAHLHLMTVILAETQIDLTGLDLPATLAAIRAEHLAREEKGDSDGWLLGHGWSVHHLGGWPDADVLERAAPGRPVALYAHDHHSRWISPTAIRLAEIDAERGRAAGELVRRDAEGAPSGVLHEGGSSLVDWVIPDPVHADLVYGLRRVAGRLAALGVTGCHDPGELTSGVEMKRGPLFYRALAEADSLPLRVHASVRAPELSAAIERGLASGQSVGRFTMGWLKLFADGSLGSRSAALLEPYSDADVNPPTGGVRGMVVTDAQRLAELLRRAGEAGIVGQVHAIGDAAVRSALEVLAGISVRRAPGTNELMPRIEHAQLVDPADQPRFGALGIAASLQPVHLRSDAAQGRAAWAERSENTFPLRALAESGAVIAFGTDAPVEPFDPWPGIAVALARRDPFSPHDTETGAAHAIDIARALRAACLDPAISAGQTDLGRLLAGHRADLMVVKVAGLADSPDPAVLGATRPLATLIDGQVVHREPRFDP
ncbi:MAG TPA: amidohydrolase [Candidatus Limnocylindrales bacterium]|nr:amidohydrolase [Candidatus Limnocylindrales bacterium]